jgi:hypothetical protein
MANVKFTSDVSGLLKRLGDTSKAMTPKRIMAIMADSMRSVEQRFRQVVTESIGRVTGNFEKGIGLFVYTDRRGLLVTKVNSRVKVNGQFTSQHSHLINAGTGPRYITGDKKPRVKAKSVFATTNAAIVASSTGKRKRVGETIPGYRGWMPAFRTSDTARREVPSAIERFNTLFEQALIEEMKKNG